MSAASFARAFLAGAVLIAAARLACSMFGFADDVAVVCGATPSGPFALAAGIAFVIVHLLFVAVAPILALAGGLVAACLPRWNGRRDHRKPEDGTTDSWVGRGRTGIERSDWG